MYYSFCIIYIFISLTNGKYFVTILKYSLSFEASNEWYNILPRANTPTPVNRNAHCSVIDNGFMYIFGGWGNKTCDACGEDLNDFWKFDFGKINNN